MQHHKVIIDMCTLLLLKVIHIVWITMWITCGQAVENYIFSVDKTFFYKILQNVKRLFYSRLILNSKNISLKAKLFKTFLL